MRSAWSGFGNNTNYSTPLACAVAAGGASVVLAANISECLRTGRLAHLSKHILQPWRTCKEPLLEELSQYP